MWYSTQDETRAMVVLNTGRNSSNGGTQQKEQQKKLEQSWYSQNETQRDDMRDNQTCVNSGLRPGFAAAARATGKTAQAADRSRGHRPTCDGDRTTE